MAGIADRSAYQAISQGKITKIGRGTLNLKDIFEFVLKREALGTETSLNEITDEEVQTNKAMLEKARADLAETEVDIEKLKLVSRKEIGGYLVNQMTILKRELLSLSRTIPSSCYGMLPEEVEAKLQTDLQKVYDSLLDATDITVFMDSQLDSK